MTITLNQLKNALQGILHKLQSKANASDVPILKDGKLDKSVIPDDAFKAELPSVTSNDNGAILQVVEGRWSKAYIPDGDGVHY